MQKSSLALFAALLLIAVTGLAAWDPDRSGLRGFRDARALSFPFEIPAFSLLDQDGHPVTREDLLGHVWIVAFIYVQCNDTCPILNTRVLQLLERTAREVPEADVRYVSFSVSREDRPRTLRRFRASYAPRELSHWSLLAADQAAFPVLSAKLGVATSAEAVRLGELPISNFLFLVDRHGYVRGRYDGLRPVDVARMGSDLLDLHRSGA